MKISDFQSKDVINIVDGKKLGHISDIDLDLRHGRIESIVVPEEGRFFGLFGGGADVIIPWQNIVKIGADVILVKLDEAKAFRDRSEGEPEREYEASRPLRERDRDRSYRDM
ncbi:YlmC/YmxH family sporulation protein [Paenibacillus sp. y28]|uniref:YlmC/YmxH family sporulation protein n=1 Tax=Paenibacillus sp. y28 TaxID=3129110 RepID=UPI00301AB6D3